ncbi:hypothetical protein C8R42DRAFT_646155 [Lentinula raphanica]|nr:hypothetical protein C8R42DRAFT_646155 [Lentinula raphanica]
MDLNCQATFENDEKMDEVFKDLVNNSKIGWGGKLPREIGGNCMDYVKGALEYLVKGKNIKQMPVKFMELWDREYKEVQKKFVTSEIIMDDRSMMDDRSIGKNLTEVGYESLNIEYKQTYMRYH